MATGGRTCQACKGQGDACTDSLECCGGSNLGCNQESGQCEKLCSNGGGCQLPGVEGKCGQGLLRCTPGQVYGDPSCQVDPSVISPEVCNGQDDDCNGEIDENYVTFECFQQVPECPSGFYAVGVSQCVNGLPTCEVTLGQEYCDGILTNENCGALVGKTCQVSTGCAPNLYCFDENGDGNGVCAVIPGCPSDSPACWHPSQQSATECFP